MPHFLGRYELSNIRICQTVSQYRTQEEETEKSSSCRMSSVSARLQTSAERVFLSCRSTYLFKREIWITYRDGFFLVWAFCLQFTKTDEVKDDIKFEMTSLFHQRPSAVRKLTNLMERWGKHQKRICPSTFKASVHRHTAGPTLAFKRSRKASSVNGFLARFCRGHPNLQGG